MSLQKEKAHKLTVEASRSTSHSRHKENSMRGTIIIVGTVLEYFVSSSLI
jgi:hypothetical protein